MATSWLIDSNVLVYAFFYKPEEGGREEPATKLRLDGEKLQKVLLCNSAGQFPFSGQHHVEYQAPAAASRSHGCNTIASNKLTRQKLRTLFCRSTNKPPNVAALIRQARSGSALQRAPVDPVGQGDVLVHQTDGANEDAFAV